jgi:carboxyl-terminal processing protease
MSRAFAYSEPMPRLLSSRKPRGLRQIPRWLTRHRVAIAFSGLSFLFGILVTNGSQAVPSNQSPYHVVEQLGRVLVLVENYYVKPVDRSKLIEGAIKGMVAELDPHSSYLPPTDFTEFQNDTEGHFVGIGVEVDARDGAITVIKPIEGSPAEAAGLRAGDRIYGIDGWSTRGKPLDQVVEKIRGERGTPIRLLIQRPGVDKAFEVEVIRGDVQVKSVIAKRLDKDIAYVGIKQFQRGTHAEFVEALGNIRLESDAPVAGLILDMRTNPGGLVHESAQVADELLNSGVIFSTRARGRVLDEVKAKSGGVASSVKLTVLVNEFTASAAELVAGAIQDQGRGVIIGARTFGKGSVQSIVELPDGAALKLTTTLYYTPSGRTIQAEGILPNIVVQQPRIEAGLPIAREQDIDGHLPSPDAAPGDASKRRRSTTADIVIPRDVPKNPVGRGDLALSMAYQVLTGDIVPTNAPKNWAAKAP